MPANDYVIVSYVKGRILRWDGTYGWTPVPICRPHQVNGAHRYATLGRAEAALRRVQRPDRNDRLSPAATAAHIVRAGDFYRPDGTFNFHLITRHEEPTP